MKNMWILVAKADQAKIYSVEYKPRRLELIRQFEHAESRLKKSDILATEGGKHDSTPRARGNTSFHSNPRRDEHTKFAKELADFLEQTRNHQRFEELIVVAEPEFQGYINNELSEPLSQLISKKIPKNYIDLTEDKLIEVIFAKPEYA